jgi:hypothetical protein
VIGLLVVLSVGVVGLGIVHFVTAPTTQPYTDPGGLYKVSMPFTWSGPTTEHLASLNGTDHPGAWLGDQRYFDVAYTGDQVGDHSTLQQVDNAILQANASTGQVGIPAGSVANKTGPYNVTIGGASWVAEEADFMHTGDALGNTVTLLMAKAKGLLGVRRATCRVSAGTTGRLVPEHQMASRRGTSKRTANVFRWDRLLPATPQTVRCAKRTGLATTPKGFIARANSRSVAHVFKRRKCRLRAAWRSSPCLKAGALSRERWVGHEVVASTYHDGNLVSIVDGVAHAADFASERRLPAHARELPLPETVAKIRRARDVVRVATGIREPASQ